MTTNAVPIIDLKSADQAADNLITYKEFISALKGSKDNLYYKILPRTLSLQTVLYSMPDECAF